MDCYQNNTLNTKQSNYYIQSNYTYTCEIEPTPQKNLEQLWGH
jgi:hypothetical protein